jgi:hypothetical protein
MNRTGIGRAAAMAAALLLLSSCTLQALHRDPRSASAAGGVTGKVQHAESDASVVVVFALRKERDAWVADNYVHLATREDFLMRLVPGKRYLMGAFADRNDNLRLDADEPAVMAPEPVTVAQGWKGVTAVDLVLAPARPRCWIAASRGSTNNMDSAAST